MLTPVYGPTRRRYTSEQGGVPLFSLQLPLARIVVGLKSSLLRVFATLALLVLGGCLPGMRDNEPLPAQPDAKADTAKADTAKADASNSEVATTDGAQGDAATTDVAADGADTEVVDATTDTTADTTDAGQDAAQEVLVGVAGCVSDLDCAKLPFGPCQAGVCNLATGLCGPKATDEGKPCELSVCVTAALCVDGICSGKEVDCKDGSECTQDDCEPGLGCVHQPLTKACDDGKKCSSGDTCVQGKCLGTAKVCQDGNACTEDLCNPGSGECNHKPTEGAKIACTLNNAKGCSGPATCVEGECKASSTCDDGNPCTLDLCADGSNCTNLPMIGACIPAGAKDDSCNPGACQVKSGDTVPVCLTAPLCQGKVCSVTKCAAGQCTYDKLDDASSCDDGDACSDATACVKGQCKGAKVSCDDGNACTTDSCKPGVGCVATSANDGSSCEDGSGCTTSDACKSGSCAGKPISCDDSVACTEDSCETSSGCVHVKGASCPP